MSKITRRDEFNDRLSSFLYKRGKLAFKNISIIKPHVFYLKTMDGNKLILKKHRRKENVEQQWNFFEQLNKSNVVPFTKFPNGQKIITTNEYCWTIAPYVRGDKLNYERVDDRADAIKALQIFHKKASNVHVSNPIRKENIFIRWYQRLLSFKKTEGLFKAYNFEALYKDIVQMTIIHLQLIKQFPWESYENNALKKGLWVHGDVASHNFIRSDRLYLIDFDLLQCTAQIYDYIQLGQRFLPYLDWDLDQLLAHQMVKNKELKAWLYAIFIPSDLLREWLYFIENGKLDSVHNRLCDMEDAWVKRHTFWKNAKSMIKSL